MVRRLTETRVPAKSPRVDYIQQITLQNGRCLRKPLSRCVAGTRREAANKSRNCVTESLASLTTIPPTDVAGTMPHALACRLTLQEASALLFRPRLKACQGSSMATGRREVRAGHLDRRLLLFFGNGLLFYNQR